MRPRILPKYAPWLVVPIVFAGATYWFGGYGSEPAEAPIPTSPEAALAELRKGNLRFINSHRVWTDTSHDADIRRRTAKGQHPFATVLCCSDSRVCPEIILDQRAGSIFEIRNAGNVVDDDVLASLEYAVEHLRVPLIVVLGHKRCGAVEAVCEAGDTILHDHLRVLQEHMAGIRREVIECHHRHDADVVDRLAEANARQQALTILRESPVVKAAASRGECRLVYGLYDLETGVAEFVDHP